MLRAFAMFMLAAVLGGCASSRAPQRPPAPSFEGILSQQILPASIIGPDWTMKQGLMIDDLANPPEIALNRRAWAEAFIKQRLAAGARSYGEIFYLSPESPPVKVSTMILVYKDVEHARAHWNSNFGAGLMSGGYQRTNRFGDKSVEHKKHDDIVVWAGNVIIQVSQPVRGSANETILNAYLEKLGQAHE